MATPMSLEARTVEVGLLLEAVAGWAAGLPRVRAVALVGSWARGDADLASDLDLVILSQAPAMLTDCDGWWSFLANATVTRRQAWGVLTERRLELGSGLEVELGVASTGWAGLPLDAGTRRVLAEGARPIHDPDGLLRRAIASLTT